MNKFKKIVAVVMTVATVGALSVGAFAVNYDNYPFDFNLGKNESDITRNEAIKRDSYNYAQVNCKEGNINQTSYMWLKIYSFYPGDDVTDKKKATALMNYRLIYNEGEYEEGVAYALQGSTDDYGAYVKGKWDP